MSEIVSRAKGSLAPFAPAQAVADGIAYVSEDRKLDGFFDTLGVGQNIGLGWLAKFGRGKVLSPFGRMRQIALELEKRLSIRRIGADQPVLQLSGGNQQKVVIAKSLVQQPRLVIFDEPTRGVDVGAISEIRQIIREIPKSGTIAAEFSRAEASAERILHAAVH